MLERFELLVANRDGHYEPPDEIRDRVHVLEVPGEIGAISATEVRERLRRGEPWEHLVPPKSCLWFGDLRVMGCLQPDFVVIIGASPSHMCVWKACRR